MIHQQQQQQHVILPVASLANHRPPPPPPPPRAPPPRTTPPPPSPLPGIGDAYFEISVPLYEASMRSDWKTAKAILDSHPGFVRYRITGNWETALHIVVSSGRRGKPVQIFVQNLVNLMTKEDLLLRNKDCNTALYLAATGGNVASVKIMARKNKALLRIPGEEQLMPLYAAALFGRHEVVKYLYNESNNLCDEDGWTPDTRGRLLEKCVEGDMFDVALRIVEEYPKLVNSKSLLGVLARKPHAFSHSKSNVLVRTMSSVLAFIGSKVGAPERESKALQLLRIILEDIMKKPKRVIDNILRGPPDSASKSVQTMVLQKLLSQILHKMDVETQKMIRGQLEPPTGKVVSGKGDEALQLNNLISEHLLNIYTECQKIIKQENMTVVVSGKGGEARRLQKFIHELITNIEDETKKIIKLELAKEDHAQHLQKLISKHLTLIGAGKLQQETFSSRPPFIAAEMGNTKFLVELIRRYPELSLKLNDNNQTVFHIAVKHRHQDIYNLLYEIGRMKDSIIHRIDDDGNSLLHLAGKRATRLEDVSGVLLQMQQELLWFKEVESIMPPTYNERKNKDDLTASELFTKEHKDLITQGEKWMKETASQCMVVATLIATIVFASAFTVPGGYDQNNGIPIFHSKSAFIIFVLADAISLFSSSASILFFLSILTSRFAQRDFLESLPKKLIYGLSTLFISITTMMIAFSVSFFVLYDQDWKWMPPLISSLAAIPVLLYIRYQYSLFTDIIRSTYGFRSLFKFRKNVLYKRIEVAQKWKMKINDQEKKGNIRSS